MRGGGLGGYFGEQGLPMGIQECLERFHRRCVDSPNCEGELPTVRRALLLVELVGVDTQPLAGWIGEGGRHGEFLETMANFEHGY